MTQTVKHPSALEGEAFWINQKSNFKASDLSRKDYCRQHQLSYHRFQYWYHKLETSALMTPKLIPVQATTDMAAKLTNNEVLCSLELQSGVRLLIHERQLVESLLAGVLK